MISLKLKHLYSDTDRHGNVRYYVAIRGAKKRRIREAPDTPEFMVAYAEALADAKAEASGAPRRRREDKGSVGWLIDRYYDSKPFSDLAEGTRARRRRMLEELRVEHGEKRAEGLPRRAVRAIMDKWGAAHGPHGANNRLKALRGLYGWAAENEIVDRDATREVEFFTRPSSGFHTWSASEIRKFVTRWPLGTAPRLAMTVMLCTGTRISDAYKLGPGNLTTRRVQGRVEQRIAFEPSKTEKTSGMRVDIPVLPMLAEAIAAGPISDEAFIVGLRGRPFTSPEALGVSFKRWCVEAGLPHCSAHGLRKGGATFLAERRGVTSQQLMAIYGWTKLEMAERYTRRADRARMSDALSGGFGFDDEDEGGQGDD